MVTPSTTKANTVAILGDMLIVLTSPDPKWNDHNRRFLGELFKLNRQPLPKPINERLDALSRRYASVWRDLPAAQRRGDDSAIVPLIRATLAQFHIATQGGLRDAGVLNHANEIMLLDGVGVYFNDHRITDDALVALIGNNDDFYADESWRTKKWHWRYTRTAGIQEVGSFSAVIVSTDEGWRTVIPAGTAWNLDDAFGLTDDDQSLSMQEASPDGCIATLTITDAEREVATKKILAESAEDCSLNDTQRWYTYDHLDHDLAHTRNEVERRRIRDRGNRWIILRQQANPEPALQMYNEARIRRYLVDQI